MNGFIIVYGSGLVIALAFYLWLSSKPGKDWLRSL